jgi:hypothetical protein
VAEGYVIPGAEIQAQKDGIADLIREPAAPGTSLGPILEAISAIVGDSRWRASVMLYSPALMAVFPNLEWSVPAKETRNYLHTLEMAGLSSTEPDLLGPMEYFLPVVPSSQTKGTSSQVSPFPPLGISLSRDNLVSVRAAAVNKFTTSSASWDPARRDSLSSTADLEVEEPESPVIPWLIHLVRSLDGMDRVMAASVLTSLFKTGLASASREADLGLLVVPLLVQMLNNVEASPTIAEFVDAQTASSWALKERTLAVLARLITDSEFLQKCAFDCQAAKTIAQLLKEAYEPLPANKASKTWSPSPRSESAVDREGVSPTCRLGARGQLPLRVHRTRMRESALKATAAMASFKDEYRKALVELDIVPYIVESLTNAPSKPKGPKDRSKPSESVDEVIIANPNSPYGTNPVSVIIAACHAVRMLSRSVSILRTSLQDFDVATPILRLLRHPDIDVQNAACAAMCNLLTEVSPMRQVSASKLAVIHSEKNILTIGAVSTGS